MNVIVTKKSYQQDFVHDAVNIKTGKKK